jgi:hypothetical protein
VATSPIGYSDGVGSKHSVINSGLTIEEDEETFDWWFTEYAWKDYSCEETPPPGSTATYAPNYTCLSANAERASS